MQQHMLKLLCFCQTSTTLPLMYRRSLPPREQARGRLGVCTWRFASRRMAQVHARARANQAQRGGPWACRLAAAHRTSPAQMHCCFISLVARVI